MGVICVSLSDTIAQGQAKEVIVLKKFLVLYLSPVSAEQQMSNGNPEDNKKMMDMWTEWFKKSGDAIVEMGSPLGGDTHIGKDGSTMSHSGDYIGGYSIVQANDIEAVKTMLSGHPHFMGEHNSIEILEMLPMPGM